MGIDGPFQNQPEAIATFNFEDIVSGTGIILLYAGTTVDKNVLSNFVFYSNKVAEAAVATGATSTYTKKFDVDFDVTINKTLELQGTAIVTVPIKVTNVAGGGASSSAYAVAILKKEDVTIVTNTGVTSGVVLATATDRGWGVEIAYGSPTIDLVIPAGTTFKVGDTLRLTVEIWAKGTSTDGTVTFAHDPQDRTQDWDFTSTWDSTGKDMTSQIKLQLPVKLNL